jgi:hypothetical protein
MLAAKFRRFTFSRIGNLPDANRVVSTNASHNCLATAVRDAAEATLALEMTCSTALK